MKNWIFCFVIALFFVIANSLLACDFPMNYLKLFANGLNIEGGTIPHKYFREKQVWANLCVILDRPFEDGIEWQELTNLNTFPLKEATILDYNEAQVNFAYATVMYYYLNHAHQIMDKPLDQMIKILIQVHRNTSGPNHLDLLENLLIQCYPHLQGLKQQGSSKYELYSYFFPAANVEISFCYGTAPENLGELGRYKAADIVLSFSLVAGMHPLWKSGSLLIPDQYIPFSLKKATVYLHQQYGIRNHLKEVLPSLLETQNETVLHIINKQFSSLNSQKDSLKAKKLLMEDFKEATLFQVDSLFNPSQLPYYFKIDCLDERLKQKVVFITGASQGIGYEIVQEFARKGYSVWAGSRSPSKIHTTHPNIHTIFLDVRNERSIQEAIRTILKYEGRIDVLVNNAGYVLISPLEIEDIEEVSKLFDVNFFGSVKVTNSVLPIMRYQKAGHVINLSSTAGIQAVPGLGYFSASKYALEAYSEALAAELTPWQIKVSIVEPGNVDTPWLINSIIHKNTCVPEYNGLTNALFNKMKQGSDEKSIEVAKVISSIVEDPFPSLRYQTSEKAKKVASNRWIDPSGLQYLNQQMNFLKFMTKIDSSMIFDSRYLPINKKIFDKMRLMY